jgi:hypothetical protein
VVQRTGRAAAVADPALAWSNKLAVEVGGAGTVAHADVEALTRQAEIYGPGGGASDTTVLRGLDELAERLGSNGLPGRRLSKVMARARERAWAAIIDRHGGLPAVRVAGADLRRPCGDGQQGRAVVVVRLDATVIQAASGKDGAEPDFKGYGFHPLTAWCSNIGDALAAMLRPGSAGSFTAADHIAVVDAAITQLPPAFRGDLLVTVDGARASHGLVDHLTGLNTARMHGRRGRRVEYSVGWPVDARTKIVIDAVREADWTPGLTAGVKHRGSGNHAPPAKNRGWTVGGEIVYDGLRVRTAIP